MTVVSNVPRWTVRLSQVLPLATPVQSLTACEHRESRTEVVMDPMSSLLFLLHVASTLFMTGVIWFVQVVHYPLFASAATTQFQAYQRTHTRLTTHVVAPAMLAELASAVLLLWIRP